MDNFQIVVGGAAGDGSKKSGLVIAKLFNSYGFRVFIHEDYHSLIRGGHNFSQISVSKDEKVEAKKDKIDILLALNKDTILKHRDRMNEGGVLIHDPSYTEADLSEEEGIEITEINAQEIVNDVGGDHLMKNTALIAALAKMMGMEWHKVSEVIKRNLNKETEKNLNVAESAFNKTEQKRDTEETGNPPLPITSGNKAVALGALKAGLESCISYPMTPATGVFSFLTTVDGVRTAQPENEISVINMALGSAYSGRRTMLATSGGGFALMTETLSFSAQSEIPILIALSQRMGPATGVPTYESQGDLLFALNAGHGDMERFLVAPGDSDEAFYWSGKALNIAWRYQMPAILLIDKELSENTYTLEGHYHIDKEDIVLGDNNKDYKRYSGEDISPIQFPGGEAIIKATGYEHTEDGGSTEEPEEVKRMQEKRMRKGERLREELNILETVKTYGEGPVAVVFWGSTKGAVLEASEDLDVKLVQPVVLQPFPEQQMKDALEGSEKIICVEINAVGQLAKLMKMYGIETDEKILKYESRPFTVEELREKLQEKIN
ncbi:MAG: 2-oxoacid:acceptor oxidoreductase subunit alpha [Candidatus Paceibacterota bacterium]